MQRTRVKAVLSRDCLYLGKAMLKKDYKLTLFQASIRFIDVTTAQNWRKREAMTGIIDSESTMMAMGKFN